MVKPNIVTHIQAHLLLGLALGVSGAASDCVAKERTGSTRNGSAAEPTSQVILTSEVKWEQLNPARGDKSPKAATLWGDRNGTGPKGFLFNSVDGFKSPPHIHTAQPSARL